MFIDLQCVGRTYSGRNPGQPRAIMCIIVKLMRIIVLEQCIRLLSILYARLPVDAVELAFFIDTNQSFLGEWVKNCWLHIPIFRVPTPCHN
jgi:hypothetical protein